MTQIIAPDKAFMFKLNRTPDTTESVATTVTQDCVMVPAGKTWGWLDRSAAENWLDNETPLINTNSTSSQNITGTPLSWYQSSPLVRLHLEYPGEYPYSEIVIEFLDVNNNNQIVQVWPSMFSTSYDFIPEGLDINNNVWALHLYVPKTTELTMSLLSLELVDLP